MALFTRWDVQKKIKGEPVTVHHKDVKKVEELVLTSPEGRRHGARIHKKDGTIIDVATPAGEVQDRLNDDIATAPEMPGAVTEALRGPEPDEEEDDDDEMDMEDDTV